MRKLLPYEHQLIEALGVTKEEYLNFVAIQQDYKDPKIGTVLDVRNETGTVALVLTIVGTLFQVGAALLAPKPEVPDGGRRQNRQQRFAPSFGFNSAQDLAKYGDPVNLIYTNNSDNPLGSVRANGSLVWSAIENFGSSQFMQLMVVVGASQLRKIDPDSIAFGQKDLSTFDKGSSFVFLKSQGDSGIPKFGDLKSGYKKNTFFPKRLAPSNSDKSACLIAFEGDKKLGFSQAYSPTTSTSLGVFDAIPINVNVLARDSKGIVERANNRIALSEAYQASKWKSRTGNFEIEDKIEFVFTKASGKGSIDGATDPGKTAIDMRRQMLESLDFSSTYMLGSAKFRFSGYGGNNKSIEGGDVKVLFECVEGGHPPASSYTRLEPKTDDEDLKKEIENAINTLSNIKTTIESDTGEVDEDDEPIFETITIIPSIIPDSDPPELFLSDEGNLSEPFKIESENPPIEIDYTGTQKITWRPVLDLVDDNGNKVSDYQLGRKSVDADRSGSIEYSKEVSQDLRDDQFIDVSAVKKKLRQQKKALKALIDDIHEGAFDGDNLPFNSNNAYEIDGYSGRSPSEDVTTNYALSASLASLTSSFGPLLNPSDTTSTRGIKLHGYDKGFVAIDVGSNVPYTFIYIDRRNVWNFFTFNGISNVNKQKFFPNDPNLRDKKRPNLKDAKGKLSNLQAQRDQLDKSTTKIKSDSVTNPNSDVRTVLNKETQLAIAQYDSDITDQEELVEERRQVINDRIERNIGILHKLAVVIIRDDINYIETIMEQLPAKDQEDKVGRQQIKKDMKAIIKQKKDDLDFLTEIIDDWDEYTKTFDNTFFSKCLVKAEKTTYETLSEVDAVNFSLKVNLSRRISGRQKKYGEEKVKKYSSSDNGVKSRMVFFRLFYKKQGGSRNIFNICFAVRRGSESDFYTQIRFIGSDGTAEQPRSKWVFEFEPVYDVKAESEINPFAKYAFIEDTSEDLQVWPSTSSQVKVCWSGRTVDANSDIGYFPDEDERGPTDTNEWDMFSVNSDTNVRFSHEAGPEIALTAVTEQQLDQSIKNKYKNLTMMSLGVYANRGLQDLRSVSALVLKGKSCFTINKNTESISTSQNSTSYAPDIFVDTLLDEVNGVGKYVDQSNIDLSSLALAKKFCINNNLPKADGSSGGVNMFMDGIVADAGSWREFWISAAPFSLLELARKNGKDTLVPALPVRQGGKAADDAGLPIGLNISALFTAGNILQGSYKEEFLDYGTSTEDLIASVIYREFQENEKFNRNRSVNVQLEDAQESSSIRETFDASQFISQREQAIMFGKLLCNQRRHIRKGIEFRTLPSEAGLEPGDFIYVDIGLKTWDHYSSGMVMKGGELNTPLRDQQAVGSSTFNFLVYKHANEALEFKSNFKALENVQVETTTEGVSTAASLSPTYEGYMFVMGEDKPNKRVFRITELAIEEEGELSVKAVEYPCFEDTGKTRAHIADFRSSKFKVS
tara:strand:+ start:4813 stop:9204 length:4392 start_codon:yes stop_codon:yes gene_type:complete